MIHKSALVVGMPHRLLYTARPWFKRTQPLMDPTEITQLIEAGFADAIVKVMSGDNTHFEALVVAEEFEGLRSLARHQLIYECLGALVGNEIHALSIMALTPEEWHEKKGGD